MKKNKIKLVTREEYIVLASLRKPIYIGLESWWLAVGKAGCLQDLQESCRGLTGLPTGDLSKKQSQGTWPCDTVFIRVWLL